MPRTVCLLQNQNMRGFGSGIERWDWALHLAILAPNKSWFQFRLHGVLHVHTVRLQIHQPIWNESLGNRPRLLFARKDGWKPLGEVGSSPALQLQQNRYHQEWLLKSLCLLLLDFWEKTRPSSCTWSSQTRIILMTLSMSSAALASASFKNFLPRQAYDLRSIGICRWYSSSSSGKVIRWGE